MRQWLSLLAAAALVPICAHAAELPDFGSPADAALSKSREAQIGRGVMLQLRNAGVIVDDPFLAEYVSTIGSRLATHVNDGDFVRPTVAAPVGVRIPFSSRIALRGEVRWRFDQHPDGDSAVNREITAGLSFGY